jgi:hypothetical protein
MKTIVSVLLTAIFSVSVMAQSPVNLKYNLDLNKKYKIKFVDNRIEKTQMYGTEQIKETETNFYFTLKPLNKANDFFMAQVQFDTVDISVSMPKMEMTSRKEGSISSEKAEDVMACILNRLCKSTLVVKMAYSGHVVDILNYPIVAKTVLSDLDSLNGQNAAMRPQLEMMIEKGSLKSWIEMITVYLPNKEVNKDETWKIQITNSQGLGSLITVDYKLNDLSENEASINGEIKIDPAGKTMEMNGAKITGDLRGTGKNEMKIDPNSGWVNNRSSEIQLSGTINVNAQGQAMAIPMEITNTTIIIGLN